MFTLDISTQFVCSYKEILFLSRNT